MKKVSFSILFLLLASTLIFSQAAPRNAVPVRIDADPKNGFNFPYYLFVPDKVGEVDLRDISPSLIVIPNNTGKLNDDIAFHEDDVKRKISQIGPVLTASGVVAPVLVPVFPRPASENRIYTHSLDRDTMIVGGKDYRRLDLQLIAMIEDARRRLKEQGVRIADKIVMQGYSASGMFVNRFVFMHPDKVKAAIIGAPGGWAIAPVSTYDGKKLTYPAGVADLREVSGKRFDIDGVRRVHLMMVLGAEDTNDAVPMGDAYDKRESDLVLTSFGKTPVERWPYTVKLYGQARLNAEFKLYPATGHQMSAEMRQDMIAFLRKHQ